MLVYTEFASRLGFTSQENNTLRCSLQIHVTMRVRYFPSACVLPRCGVDQGIMYSNNNGTIMYIALCVSLRITGLAEC